MRIALPNRVILAPEHVPRVREVGDPRQLAGRRALAFGADSQILQHLVQSIRGTVRTCGDCPASCRAPGSRLGPSESSVGSPDALRNGRIASEIAGPAGCRRWLAALDTNRSRRTSQPASERDQQTRRTPESTIVAHAATERDRVRARPSGMRSPWPDVCPTRGQARAPRAARSSSDSAPRVGLQALGHQRVEPSGNRRIDRSQRRRRAAASAASARRPPCVAPAWRRPSSMSCRISPNE